MADILQEQYKSVFSTPLETYETLQRKTNTVLEDIDFNESDVIEAISSISTNAAPGPDGFPAILLKNSREQLAKPLKTFWRKCIEMGITIDIHKNNNITSIYKGGDQGDPSNLYR